MEPERKSQDGLAGSVGRAPGVVKTKAERSCAVVTGIEVSLVQTEKRELTLPHSIETEWRRRRLSA